MRGIEQIPWIYDAAMAVIEATGLRRWRDWLTQGARGRTLEVGCGTGRNLTRYAVPVIAVDPSADALEKARRRAPKVPLVRASAEALPFRDGAFETVVSSLVFCSVDKPRAGLAEIRRLLAPSGELRMLEHVRSSRPLEARWQDFIQPLWTRVMGGCHPNRDTERTVVDAGFTLEELRAKGTMRRFRARPVVNASSATEAPTR